MNILTKEIKINSAESMALDGLAQIAKDRMGFEFGENKYDFIASRVQKRLLNLNIDSFQNYLFYLQDKNNKVEVDRFLECITTHTTNFFREIGHYDWIKKDGLNELVGSGAGVERDLTIWSAACSAGQELYSAMMLVDHEGLQIKGGIKLAGLGTDISTKILRIANNSVYTKDEISLIPNEYKKKYVLQSKKDKSVFRISPYLRGKTQWKRQNITDLNKPISNNFDIIFLRNVLIYFSKIDQNNAVRHIVSRLSEGGFLLTGHSESGIINDPRLKLIRPTIYQKKAL